MKTQLPIIRWGLSALTALALVPFANATIINFSAHHSDDNITVTSADLSGPNGVAAGLEAWNLNNFNDGAPQSGLFDSTGAVTGVGVTFDGLGGPDDWGYGASLKLLWRAGRGFYNGPGNAASFTISGLTVGTQYNLWIATAHLGNTGDAKGVGDWTTSNVNSTGSSIAVNNTGFETNGSTWVEGINYVLFSNVEPDATGHITMTEHTVTPNLTDARVGFNGFQLVSVPEPSTAMLAGVGLLALLRRRRSA
jgi:MYXO-CTERM domain-containing protein